MNMQAYKVSEEDIRDERLPCFCMYVDRSIIKLDPCPPNTSTSALATDSTYLGLTHTIVQQGGPNGIRPCGQVQGAAIRRHREATCALNRTATPSAPVASAYAPPSLLHHSTPACTFPPTPVACMSGSPHRVVTTGTSLVPLYLLCGRPPFEISKRATNPAPTLPARRYFRSQLTLHCTVTSTITISYTNTQRNDE
jgi:hypothetical protein